MIYPLYLLFIKNSTSSLLLFFCYLPVGMLHTLIHTRPGLSIFLMYISNAGTCMPTPSEILLGSTICLLLFLPLLSYDQYYEPYLIRAYPTIQTIQQIKIIKLRSKTSVDEPSGNLLVNFAACSFLLSLINKDFFNFLIVHLDAVKLFRNRHRFQLRIRMCDAVKRIQNSSQQI